MTTELDIIHHTAIQVRDIATAVSWYSKRYRCQIEYQDESWALLKFANTSIALVIPEQHPYHFAIVSDNIEQYGEPVPHRDGTSSVYIKDEDGNHVEMIQIPKTTTSDQ